MCERQTGETNETDNKVGSGSYPKVLHPACVDFVLEIAQCSEQDVGDRVRAVRTPLAANLQVAEDGNEMPGKLGSALLQLCQSLCALGDFALLGREAIAAWGRGRADDLALLG